jgi:nucleoid-associated protein YgaU
VARHTSRAGHRAGRIFVGLSALAALVVLLVGVPLVLLGAWRYLGPPLPSWQELSGPDDGTLFVRVLCLIGWAGWVTFAWSVLAEIVAQVLGWRLPALPWQRRMAAGLVAAVALTVSSPAIASTTATPVLAAPAVAAPVFHAPQAQAVPVAPTAGPATTAGYREHRVQPGEQMPALAERYLGDKYRWQAIAAATYGIEQPDGRTLRPGDTRVYPGWIVRVPVRADAGRSGLSPYAPTTALTATPAVTPVYVVARGDWLWHIADRFLGDPERYTEIEALNPGLEHRDGRFPDHIEATWRVVLPTDAHDRGARTHATGTVLVPPPPPNTKPGDIPPPVTGPGATPPGAVVPDTSATPSAPSTPSTPPSVSPRPTPSASAATAIAGPGGSTAASPGAAAPGVTPSAQTPTPAPPPAAGNGQQPAEDGSMLDQALLIGVPLFGAGLLAALVLTSLRQRRRRQEQHRPVGRRLPEPVEAKVETQLRVVAQPIAVDRLDHAMRVLAAALVDRSPEQMPDIIGAWLQADTINLLLTRPCADPPAPWTGDELNWTLPGDIALPDVDGQLAPLPILVAVGSQPGMHLMLDLERLGVLTITGDPGRTGDLLRYLAAELSCNAWSDHVEVTVAGFDAIETGELIALGGDRIDAAPSIAAAIDRIRRRASQVVQSLDHLGAVDPLTGRIADIAADAWMPRVLLVSNPGPDEVAALEALDRDLSATGRCAVAIAVTARDEIGRWPVAIDADGRLTIEFLGMTGDDAHLTAAGLPRTELGGLADLLNTARRGTPTAPGADDPDPDQGTDWPRVPPAPEREPWAQGTDAAGGLLDNLLGDHEDSTDPDEQGGHDPADDEAPDEPAQTAVPTPAVREPEAAPVPKPLPPLPRPAADSNPPADEAARIPAVVALTSSQAPTRKRVSAPVRRRHSDPSLDIDVRAWNDADPTRPRFAILGPVTVDAAGQQPTERLRFYAEIIVYLAARGSRGATTDQFNEAIWPGQQPKAASRRVAVARARRWLGETEGEPWLPDATSDRRYRLREGYLFDWHLYRRLRSRGEARGPAGTGDLRQALALVRGAPLAGADVAYSTSARNPYVWLPTSEIQPHHLASAVVDTAHRLVELCLDGGDIAGARWAVEQAWLADPDRASDIAWRDLLRVAGAEGNTAELDQLLGDLMRAREAEIPEDLDKDTYRLLCDLMPERMRAGVR